MHLLVVAILVLDLVLIAGTHIEELVATISMYAVW